MAKKTIDQVEVEGKRILMRVDFNVPIDENGRIANDGRIVESLASIKSVVERGGKLILMSHLGRPEGTGYEKHLSLKPVAERLQEMLPGAKVTFPGTDCVGQEAADAVKSMQNGEIVVLENLRFHAEEQKNDPGFAAKLAGYADIYCNEAFGTAHRNDASMHGVPNAMDGKPRVAGFLLRKELRYLSDTIANAEKPFVAVLGGAKVSDKLGAIHNLMNKVDTILVGGAMAYTFLKALNRDIGSSLVQLGMVKQAEQIMDEVNASKTELILPQDHVCGRQVTHMTPVKVFSEHIEDGWMGLDIGPRTVGEFCDVILGAKTIVWNGPMGVFETKPFDVGTRRVAEAIAQATVKGATSVVGGGDSVSAVHSFGLADKFSHVSTGGGASLQMLEGRAFETVDILDSD
jgi:phosphoglycerate kinase